MKDKILDEVLKLTKAAEINYRISMGENVDPVIGGIASARAEVLYEVIKDLRAMLA